MREKFLTRIVGNPNIDGIETISDLFSQFRQVGGFTVERLVKAVDYMVEMYLKQDVTILFSFTANFIINDSY